jgi:DivIVA domain-containing protein
VVWVLFTVIAVLVVGAFAALLAGRVGYDPLASPVNTQPDPGLPEAFSSHHVAGVHFDTALRGYRMDQVDEILDRLLDRLADQEAELRRLRTEPAGEAGAGSDTVEDRPDH